MSGKKIIDIYEPMKHIDPKADEIVERELGKFVEIAEMPQEDTNETYRRAWNDAILAAADTLRNTHRRNAYPSV